MNAMIFAAGLGTRLRPLTNDRPKAMVEVAGRPMIEHLILKLKREGFGRVVVNVHHFGEQIIDFIRANDQFGIDIRISDERQQLLDTGGGIRRALSLFDDREPVLIHNVDIISSLSLAELWRAHTECPSAPAATLAVNERETQRYLLFDDSTRLMRGWTNIKTGEVRGELAPMRRAFSGIHVVDSSLFPLLEARNEEVFPIMDFYLGVCQQMPLRAFDLPAGTQWVDCGKPESLVKAEHILAASGRTR